MANRNFVLLEGFLGNDPDVRYTSGGTKVVNLRLATNYGYKDKDGEQQRHTSWHALVFYDWHADEAEHYRKGENIHIEGHIEDREFTPKDGAKRIVKEVIVQRSHVIARSRAQEHDDDGDGDVNGSAEDEKEGVDDDNWPA